MIPDGRQGAKITFGITVGSLAVIAAGLRALRLWQDEVQRKVR